MSGKQLILCQGGIAGPGTDKAGFPHRIVPNHYTFDGLNVWSLIVHVRSGKLRPEEENVYIYKNLTVGYTVEAYTSDPLHITVVTVLRFGHINYLNDLCECV